MRIKITVTPKELQVLQAIENGERFDTGRAFQAVSDGGLVNYSSRGYALTDLGILALEQNRPKEKAVIETPLMAIYKECVAYWLKEFHVGWQYGAIHGMALKSIINKIRKAQPEAPNATIVATFKKLCQSLPQWYRDKDLPVINSKWNEIITEIQRGPSKGGWNQSNSAERVFG